MAARFALRLEENSDAYKQPNQNPPPPHVPRPLAFARFPKAVGVAHHHLVRRADHEPGATADRGAAAARDADADGRAGGARNAALRAVQPACGGAARPGAQAAGGYCRRPRARLGVGDNPDRRLVRRTVDGAAVRRWLPVRRAECRRRCGLPGAARADGRTQAPGRSERQDFAGRDVGGTGRTRHGRRPDSGVDGAVRHRLRRVCILRFSADVAACRGQERHRARPRHDQRLG